MEDTKKLSNNIKIIIGVVIAIIVGFCVFKVIMFIQKAKQPEITEIIISQKLEDASELVTQKLTYKGEITLSSGKIPFLTKNSITLSYKAEIRSGIDPKEIDSEIMDDVVILSVPHASILSCDVDEKSLKLLDEDSALFGDKKSKMMIEAL